MGENNVYKTQCKIACVWLRLTFETVRPYSTKTELLELSTELPSYARRKTSTNEDLYSLTAILDIIDNALIISHAATINIYSSLPRKKIVK